MDKKRISFYEAIAVLIGTTIGAGVMGIPYVVSKSGWFTGLIDLLILSLVILMINLYVGEVCLRTKKVHQLAGFAELYLGKRGKLIMAVITLLSIIGALVAYIIGVGQVLGAIFSGNVFIYSLGFFVIGALIIYFDLFAVKKTELYLDIFVLSILLAIIAVCFFNFDFLTVPYQELSWTGLFIPYGVILFALVGASAIPEMEVVLKNNKKQLKKAIIIGTLIPFFLYLLFMIAVIGVTGLQTTEIATVGLGQQLGEYMVLLGNLFPIFSMSTSFFILGLALKWMLHYDYKLSNFSAWFITCFIPLALFLLGARSFITIIGITGAIAGGLEGIMIVLIAKAAKKKSKVRPNYEIRLPLLLEISIIILFILGIIFQFVKF